MLLFEPFVAFEAAYFVAGYPDAADCLLSFDFCLSLDRFADVVDFLALTSGSLTILCSSPIYDVNSEGAPSLAA